MIYDVELAIRDLENVFKNKLNDEIALINAEKQAVAGDSLFLNDIPAEKYIFETLDERLLNYKDFFILYGMVNVPVRDPNQTSFIKDLTVTFQVGTFDKGEKERNNTLYKLLRYQRALEQVIMKNPDVFRGYARPDLISLKPDAYPYDRKRVILKAGIDVKASTAAY